MVRFVLIGLVGMAAVILYRRAIVARIGSHNRWVKMLTNAEWFQHYGLAGIFLFTMNAFLFLSTGLVIYILTYFLIPYLHLLMMFLAVCASIYLWALINRAWQGKKRDRLKLALIGSSFYIFLTAILVYSYMTLEPAYPGEDIFMKAVGIVFAGTVTGVATIVCLAIVGGSKRKSAL